MKIGLSVSPFVPSEVEGQRTEQPLDFARGERICFAGAEL